jgi:uncharacterized protein DUF4410
MHSALTAVTSIASALSRVSARAILAAAVTIMGCAGKNASDESRADPSRATPPMIYVHNFDLGAATLKADPHTISGRPRLIDFGATDPVKKLEDLSDLLARSLVEDLHKKNLLAQRLPNDAPNPTTGWLVSGAFLEVVEGNRLQKAVIGFGAGQSNASLYVGVADLARPPGQQDLLDLHVRSEGSKTPGGAVALIEHTPYGMAAKYALDRNASEHDIKRTASSIADGLEKLVRAQK